MKAIKIIQRIGVIFLLATGILQAQNLYIPDANLKNALLNYIPAIDTNSDGEISVFEAQVPTQLNLNYMSIADMTGIESFISLTKLWCNNNQITTGLNLTQMSQLQEIDCYNNVIPFLNIAGLTNLQRIYCGNNQITELDLSTATGIQSISASNNQINSLLLPLSTSSLTSIAINNNQLSGDLDFTGHAALQLLWLGVNAGITSVDASGLVNLTSLTFGNNTSLQTVDASNCPALSELSFGSSCPALSSLNVQGNTSLGWLDCKGGSLTTLDVSNLPALYHLDCRENDLTFLDVTNLPALELVYCRNNQIANIMDYSGSPLLETLLADYNDFPSIDLSNHTALTSLNCSNNPVLHTYNVQNCTGLIYLGADYCPMLTTINIQGCTAAQGISFSNDTSLTNLTVSATDHPNLVSLSTDYSSSLNSLVFSGTMSIQQLQTRQCNLSVLDLTNLPNLSYLSCQSNNLTTLDISQNPALTTIWCNNNRLTTLDASQNIALNNLQCYSNNLETLFIKNGTDEAILNFVSNPSLAYICADESQVVAVQAQASASTVVNSYCSFTPGGNYNTITGTVIFDLDNDGCDSEDSINPYVKVTITDGTTTSSTFTNDQAVYTNYVGIGTYTITPDLENIGFFQVTPLNSAVTFPDINNNIFQQDFCVTANGVHPDLEIVIEPYLPVIPGFMAMYNIVYKNKGNQVLSQANGISFAFDDNYLEFSSASEAPSVQNFGELNWDFTDLKPFESRNIMVSFMVNPPTDPDYPVNGGDIFTFTANILPVLGDEIPEDNTFVYNETAVNAYDPNNIVCIQGDIVPPSYINEYLHYVVNFENTGTSEAQNVVVRIEIDETEFDISTLQILDSSHGVTARVMDNILEFIFQSINLDTGGHGNILFKMRTKESLNVNDFVSNEAGIYFDYNFPIETNEANTVFQSLSNSSFENNISLVFPNPAENIINIEASEAIKKVEFYDIQGRLVLVKITDKQQLSLEVSNLVRGSYILKIRTDKGTEFKKIILK